jgi:hypothetical protein
MELNLGQWVVIVLCALLLIGYIRGFYYNRARAASVLAWLQEGLGTLGSVSLGERLPGMATGGRLEVKRAGSPLRRIEAAYLLAPRENLFFWIFHLLLRKQDELILWVTYQSGPLLILEVARRGDRQFAGRLQAADKKPLNASDGPHGLLVATERKKGVGLSGELQAFLERYGAHLNRLSLRENKPHLFMRMDLRLMKSVPAVEFFATLRGFSK